MTKIPLRPFIYPITDRQLAGSIPINQLVADLCRGGARLIQLREKDLTTRELYEVATGAVSAAHASGALLLVNDRPDIAIDSKADGVHLGDEDLEPAVARKVLGSEAIIGVSCHSLDDVESAEQQPVDYIAVGPVFPTDTKQLRYEVVGTELVRQARNLTALPLVAIGGINASNANDVIAAGADGLAVISALMRPGEVEDRTRAMVDMLKIE